MLITGTAQARNTLIGPIIYVHDADTIHVRSNGQRVRVRLWGVDSQELSTLPGRQARDWAVRQWEGKQVRCVVRGYSWHRPVGHCFIGKTDVSLQLIKSGHGCEWWKFSRGFFR